MIGVVMILTEVPVAWGSKLDRGANEETQGLKHLKQTALTDDPSC